MTPGGLVVITGGTKGYGRALAAEFSARGADVIATGRQISAQDRLPGITYVFGDITSPEHRDEVLAVARTRGAPRLLVNNAAIQTPIPVLSTAPGEAARLVHREFAVDLIAPLDLTLQFLPDMVAGTEPSRIVFITSTLAFAPKRSTPGYNAAKAALSAFARSLDYQLTPTQVSAVSVTLPLVDTQMTAGRGARKLTPQEAARRTIRALERNAAAVDIGDARAFRLLHRIAPRQAERLTRDS
ncbi:SDR family NAD(P)-dependent oxidoreductase [Leifsonia sp. AG29]|uniref:SDR family NAD(P)-dependent oxidoreductase n=1 Tax=Leifsonia sp. AG29 TaxID=2598860 RepID=UPI00131DF390|nr:SDR family NAD(P)-dependent oxidoreductase [Leifsonia sp. AG29]